MTQTTSISDTLALAIESAQAGNTILARMHLQEVLAQDPTNLDAWLWLAWCAESPDSAVRSLEHLLTIDPDHELAWKGLIWASEMAEFRLPKNSSPQRSRRGGALGTTVSDASARLRIRRRSRAGADKSTSDAGQRSAAGFDPEPSDSVFDDEGSVQQLDDAAATADTLIMPANSLRPSRGTAEDEQAAQHVVQDDAGSAATEPESTATPPVFAPTKTGRSDIVTHDRGSAGDEGLAEGAFGRPSEAADDATPLVGAAEHPDGKPGTSVAGAAPAGEAVEEWKLPESFSVEPEPPATTDAARREAADAPTASSSETDGGPHGSGDGASETEHTERTGESVEADDSSDVLPDSAGSVRTPESMLATESAAEQLIESDLSGSGGRQPFESNVVPLDEAERESGRPVSSQAEVQPVPESGDADAWQRMTTRELPTWDPDPFGEADEFAAEGAADAVSATPSSRPVVDPDATTTAGDRGTDADGSAADDEVTVSVTTPLRNTGDRSEPSGTHEDTDSVAVTIQRDECPGGQGPSASSCDASSTEAGAVVAETRSLGAARVKTAESGDSEAEAAPPSGTAPADAEQCRDEVGTEAPDVATSDPLQAEERGAGAGAVAAADADGPVVLVVDDSATVRKLVSMTLEKHGYRVVTAFDGVAAIKEIAAHNPALILMDINMPRLDGYQLCKLVKKHPATSHIPVLMLSGKDGMFDKLRGKLVGASGYITKPFSPEGLIEVVSRELKAVSR